MSRFQIINCEQRSDAWYAARAGRFTGSVAYDAMHTVKSGAFSAARKHLRTKLAIERTTGRSQESAFASAAMQHGIEKEPMTLARHEATSGLILTTPGFLQHTEVFAGCSLDAAVMDGDRIVGIVEGKAPESATHFEYLRTRQIPEEYRWQCLHNLWISGADWCDFCSFDDRFEAPLDYLCIRIQAEPKLIRSYEVQALAFLAEVAEEVEAINKLRQEMAA